MSSPSHKYIIVITVLHINCTNGTGIGALTVTSSAVVFSWLLLSAHDKDFVQAPAHVQWAV